MTLRNEQDHRPTRARATRRKDPRARQAGRLVSRAAWLDGLLVCWTGEREEVPRLAGAPLPLRAVLQDRLARLPAGLYAVRLAFPDGRRAGARAKHATAGQVAASSGGALDLDVSGVEQVTRGMIASTARAVEAAARFPKAGARLVGPVDRWRHGTLARLDRCRQAVDGFDAWRSGSRGSHHALALEAGALWLGAVPPPSMTAADPELATLTAAPPATDASVARLAAIALGRRHKAAACHVRLSAWATAGSGLDRWPAAGAAWAATAIDPDALTALAAAAPSLNSALAARWMEERAIDRRPLAIDELRGLASLVAAVERTRGKPGTAPGGVLDSAGSAAVVAAANRLRWRGAQDASEALALWIEACRRQIPPGSFWQNVLAVVPCRRMPFDATQARNLVAALRAHARCLATGLRDVSPDESTAVRDALPVVLARGPDAAERGCRFALWIDDAQALDAALRWTEAAERLPRAQDPAAAIPLPRRVFAVRDQALRDALFAVGLRAWGDKGRAAAEVEWLLATLAHAAAQSTDAHWGSALPSLVDVAVGLARRLLGPTEHPVETGFVRADLVCAVLDVCTRWRHAGFADASRLARILASRWPSAEQAAHEWDLHDNDRARLLIALSEGRMPRFLALLHHPSAPRQFEWRAIDGWSLVAAHPAAHAWISACLDRPKLVSRVVQLLERLALVARLEPGLTPKKLFKPLDRPVNHKATWPPWVSPDAVAMLDEVARASAAAGLPGATPGVLQRLLDRSATDARELTVLRERARGAGLSVAERARLEKLERLSGDPERWSADLDATLRSALAKHVALAGLSALEALVRRELERRWREVLGGGPSPLDSAAWDNALHMLRSVKHNRRVLVRLLRQAARGDRVWMRDLAPNRTFLAALGAAGLQPDKWLADWSLIVASRSGPLTVYAATDPLEVLQMGSLFGTCLSAGKVNAYAAVAAAVEANKRVLYVKDAAGRVLGRQLLALTADGELMGFTAYGAGSEDPEKHGALVKLALELLALAIARASGARPMSAARVALGLSDAEERSLMLFCSGYVDSLEPFDWWIEALARADPRSGEDDRSRLRLLLEGPVPPDLDAREHPAWKRDELGWSACRALLWLGTEAPRLSEDQQTALGLGASHRLLLGRRSRGSWVSIPGD